VKIGYLQQEVCFSDEEKTILETFRESHVCTEGEARGILARFLFYSEYVFKKVKNLSGGERSRLRLCQLMHEEINTLVLDEPTNHLDIMGREMLEEALLQFQGTMIFISHDRYFINKLARKVAELSNKKLIIYLGNYDYYKEKKLLKKQNDLFRSHNKENKKSTSKLKVNQRNIVEKSNTKKLKLLEDEINKYESLILEKEEEVKLYATDFSKLNDLYNDKSNLEKHLNVLLDEWIALKE